MQCARAREEAEAGDHQEVGFQPLLTRGRDGPPARWCAVPGPGRTHPEPNLVMRRGRGRWGRGLGCSAPSQGHQPHPCLSGPARRHRLLPRLSPRPPLKSCPRKESPPCGGGIRSSVVSMATTWDPCCDLCLGKERIRAQKGAPGTAGCTAVRGSGTGVGFEGASLSVAGPVGAEGSERRGSGGPSLPHPPTRPGQMGPVCRREPDKARPLPAEGAGSGAWPPAWARPGAGAQLSASPPPSPRTPAGRRRLWGPPGAGGLAGWDPRERSHSNQLSEDWVPVGPRLLLAGA